MKYFEFFSEKEWTNEVARKIIEIGENSIKTTAKFNIVLTGGDTPRLIYKALSNINVNWKYWYFWLSDERFDHFNNQNILNIEMINQELFSKINITSDQIHFIDTNLSFCDSINKYKEELKTVNTFDLVILGVGEDGHTAGLFPGNHIGEEKNSLDVIGVFNSPKVPKNRITMSANKLSCNERLIFIAKGKTKKNIITKLLNGDDDLPCLKIKSKVQPILYYSHL